MIGHNKRSRQKQCQTVSWKKSILVQINKNFKKILKIHNLILYFLTKEITNVHDLSAYFIEYVCECYFLWNNSSYIFWNSKVWTSLKPKLVSKLVFKLDLDFKNNSVNVSVQKLNQVWSTTIC